ncbi:MAG: Gfo/Idh/MocA family oxidoreductase [Verrucomicrobiales bacterium]|nr:Gfo/Idh/MocA family oxidoreductase [Verrucomicrobiales bacterium]
MNQPISRRHFVASTLTAGAAIALMPRTSLRAANAASNKIVLAVAGVRSGAPGGSGRGLELINKFAALPGVEFKYVVDVNKSYLAPAAAITEKKQGKAPLQETDFRRVLEDKEVDALIVATPDHWHAPMAILGAKAGKHIYVEKPCCHNPHEGEILVEVAQKYKRLVQMGSQRRSIANVRQMVSDIQAGVIGNLFLAQCFYSRRRPNIGFGKAGTPPAELDWDLWQGPAPRTAYRDNIAPYNWHWFWRWGTGEALNNGTHLLDVARWAMNVTFPTKVSSFGGRWHDVGLDDWEAPDTQEIQLEFGPGKGISWFGRSCSTYGAPGYKANGIVFYGNKGTIDYDGAGSYTVYNLDNKPLKTIGEDPGKKSNLANGADPGLNDTHALNFIESIRGGAKLNAPIEQGYTSTVLGLLGNIAQRVGHSLQIDPKNGHILGDRKAARLWTRDYAPGWKPTV